MRAHDFRTGLEASRLLAIIRGTDADAAVKAALTLLEEGVRYLEISLNTVDALRVLGEVVRNAPAGAEVGAGTVLTVDDVSAARDAGASFIVTPGVTESLAQSVRLGLPVLAGALTPTEAIAAYVGGASAVKLFPASLGGPRYLAALRDPLLDLPFVPVGGVDADLAGQYLAGGAMAVGVGSPLVRDAAAGGDLAALRERAHRFLAVVKPYAAFA